MPRFFIEAFALEADCWDRPPQPLYMESPQEALEAVRHLRQDPTLAQLRIVQADLRGNLTTVFHLHRQGQSWHKA